MACPFTDEYACGYIIHGQNMNSYSETTWQRRKHGQYEHHTGRITGQTDL